MPTKKPSPSDDIDLALSCFEQLTPENRELILKIAEYLNSESNNEKSKNKSEAN